MSRVEDLDPLLKSLEALKPPGASKSKIAAITQLCVENVQSDSLVAQKLFTHFKRTPTTHKLGVLYVVDSITRQWIDKARQNGQELSGSSAPNGTYASGVHRMTELMPSLVDDMVRFAPQDQKDKVENLVNIWERSSTFPAKLLADFKARLKGIQIPSATPPGSPPRGVLQSLGLQKGTTGQQPPPSDAASVLKALAGLGNPQQQPPPPQFQQSAPPQPPKQDLSALLSTLGQPPAAMPQQPPSAPPPPFAHFNPPPPQQGALPPQLAALFPGAAPPQPPPPQALPAQNPLAALTAMMPPHILGNPEQLAKVLQLFQELTKAGIPQDQWAPVVAALYPGNQQAQPQPPAQSWQPPPQQNDFGGRDSRDGRLDSYGGGRRDRSRSPGYRRDRGQGVNRRPSPVYGTYDASAKDRNDFSSDGGRQNYRQRSPPGARNSGGPPAQSNGPKWTDIDHTLPPRHIKVLSRTLFVGGANGSEADLRAIFGRYGQVQTCIVNNDKRHAFVKMCTREAAVKARDGMESNRDPDVLSKARQTKWGVGFGPRECCNYATGVSTIPIDNLTEADNKWVLTAEYGGTGGRPIEPGLVFEEPDIEIGAGVSSKAMSRRVMPDTGGKRGRGGRDGGGGHQRFRQPEPRYESHRPEPVNIQPPPPVPNFGFQFAMPGQQGGMPPYQ